MGSVRGAFRLHLSHFEAPLPTRARNSRSQLTHRKAMTRGARRGAARWMYRFARRRRVTPGSFGIEDRAMIRASCRAWWGHWKRRARARPAGASGVIGGEPAATVVEEAAPASAQAASMRRPGGRRRPLRRPRAVRGMSLARTGAPQARASTTGNPSPSASLGCKTRSAPAVHRREHRSRCRRRRTGA